MRVLKPSRKHFLEDLRPYMCTYLECSTANELYHSSQDWLAHEQQIHRQAWRCHDHANKPYDSEASFQAHLASKHQSMNPKEIEAFSEFARVAVDDTRSHCSICLIDVTELAKPQSFFKHMSNQFETFATFALSRNVSLEDDDVLEGSDKVIVNFEPSEQNVVPDTENDWYDDKLDDTDQAGLHNAAAKGDLYSLHGLLNHNTDADLLNSMDQEE